MTVHFNSEKTQVLVSDLPDGTHSDIIDLEEGATIDCEDDAKTRLLVDEEGQIYKLVPVSGFETEEDVDLTELLEELGEDADA